MKEYVPQSWLTTIKERISFIMHLVFIKYLHNTSVALKWNGISHLSCGFKNSTKRGASSCKLPWMALSICASHKLIWIEKHMQHRSKLAFWREVVHQRTPLSFCFSFSTTNFTEYSKDFSVVKTLTACLRQWDFRDIQGVSEWWCEELIAITITMFLKPT